MKATNYEIVNSSKLARAAYQRPLSPRRVQAIVNQWDETLANEPKLSFRDGKYYCFDGQHTIAARKVRNGGKDLDIRCKVYYGLTYEEEAWEEAHQHDNVKRMSALETVKALYEAKDRDVVNMFSVTNGLGIEMTFGTSEKDGKINCLDTALNVYRRYGAPKYIEIMSLIRDTWGGSYPCYNANIVRGVADFYTRYSGRFSRPNFIKKLSAVHPVALMRDAKLRIGSRTKVCDEICAIYNRRLHNKLCPDALESA